MGELRELWVIAPRRVHAVGGQAIADTPLTDDEFIEAFNSGPFEPLCEVSRGAFLWHLAVMTLDAGLRGRLARLAGVVTSRAALPASRVDVKEYEPDEKVEGETKEVTRSRTLQEIAAKREYRL